MAENKNKTIIESALNEMKHIKAAINANSKEILRSTMKEEINEVMNESMNYEDEAMEDDYETTDDVATEPAVDATPDAEVADADIDADVEGSEDYEETEGGLDSYEDDAEIDLTGADNDTVIKVYKQLSGEDQIEVVGDTVHLNVTEPGEYVIKLPNQAETTDVVTTDLAPAEVSGDEIETDVTDLEDELDTDDADDLEIDLDSDDEMSSDDEIASDDENSSDEETEEEVEEAIYEIEVEDDEEQIAEEKAVVKAHEDKETSGDNLEGGFEKDHNGKDGNHAEHVMEVEEPMLDSEETEGDEIEESIPVGNAEARRIPGRNTPIKGAGAKAVKTPAVKESESKEKYNALVEKYNALVKLTKQHIKENTELKEVVGKFRTMLGENVVYTTNLSYVTKLFSEHSFTKDEKKQIIARFDEEATTIKESKKIYKSIINEIANKPTITESVSKVIDGGNKTTSTSQLNESVAYSNPLSGRILNLIDRVENSGKYN